MARERQRSRDSGLTAVDGSDQARAEGAMTNPIRAPELVKNEKDNAKNKDMEAQVNVEKSSVSDSSIKVKQLTWVHAAGLMFTCVFSCRSKGKCGY